MDPSALAAVLRDPAWICHRYDPGHDAFHFRRVPRERHRQVAFLIDGELGPEPKPLVVRRSDLPPVNHAPHFIFHSAFCGSTMLVRALDREGSAMGLSEPVVLNDLVGWRRRGARPEQHGPVMADALRLLGRPWDQDGRVVVKPSNVFNGLGGGALGLSPHSKAILLTAPLPVFLASVARKGLDGRLWVRELLEGLLQDGLVDLGFEPRDYLRQTDLQVTAVAWLAQHAWFARLIARFGPGRTASLDSETLTARPAEAVAAAARFLGLPAGRTEAYAGHPAIARNSKDGSAFSAEERARLREAAVAAHRDELAKVEAWAEAVADNAGVAMTLPGALAVGD